MITRKNALPGMRYGTLTVVEEAEPYLCIRHSGKESKSRRVKCICDCGYELITQVNGLPSSFKEGCYICRDRSGTAHKGFGGVGRLSKTKWSNIYYGAIRRGISVDITIKDAWELFIFQEQKCALTKELITLEPSLDKVTQGTASLDRIDSSLGYIKGNIQWVHKDINLMKQSLSQKDFISLCKKVAENNT